VAKNYIGSGIIDRLRSRGIGNTGPTGPTGNIGFIGSPGPTGDTGPHLVGISLFGMSLWNNFSDGTSAAASGIAKGKTGPAVYLADAVTVGSGISLVHSVDLSGIKPIINLRPIKFEGQTVRTVGSKVIVTANPSTTSVSVSGSANKNNNIVKFLNGSGTLVGITRGFATLFVQANEINNTTSYPHTDSSYYDDYVQTLGNLSTGLRIAINPKPSSNKPLLKAIHLDMNNGGNPGLLTSVMIYNTKDAFQFGFGSFTLYVENAKGNSPTEPGSFDIAHTIKTRTTESDIGWFTQGISPFFNRLSRNSTKQIGFCSDIQGTTCSSLIVINFISSIALATSKYINSDAKCLAFGYTPTCTDTSMLGPGGTIKPTEENIFYSSSAVNSNELGACCKNDGTCELRSVNDCYGYFHGSGTTCGSTGQFVCNQKGPCCINNGIAIVCHDDILCSDCLQFNNVPGIVAKFGGTNLSCADVDCSLDIFTGACCDGTGNCFQLSNSECIANGGFYHGNFSKCITNGISICSGSTGACCIDGSCQQLTYANCINSGGIFTGYNKTCNNVICSADDICSSTNTEGLLPGNEFGGGVIVGRFTPGISKILGCSSLFSKNNYAFTTETKFQSSLFTSELEPEANMVDISCQEDAGGYLIIVYPNDISTDGNYTVKNPLTETTMYNTFHWGLNGYSSWGPITNFGVYSEIEYRGISYINDIINYNEGYWYRGVTGSTLSDNLEFINENFKSCYDILGYEPLGESKVFNKSHYSLHGNWFRSNGLYNSLRAMYSLKATSLGMTGYMPSTPNIFNIIDQLSTGITSENQGITGNPIYLSDWFVPSHDEMAFIAAKTLNTADFNINLALLEKGYQPLNGNYWTSTGSFDYTKEEGKYEDAVVPASGTVAFDIGISETGNIDYYTTNKSSRQQKNKLRPIRILRCDERYPSQSKIWKLPKL